MEIAKQKVTIHICNEQLIDGHPEKIEMSVKGFVYAQENRIAIEYTEYDEEMQKIETVVRAEEERFVSVTRSGAYQSQMLFEKGKRNTTVYSTPYGDLTMGMYTKSIQNTIPTEGDMNGTLSFHYTTDFAAQGAIENQMRLTLVGAKEA